MRFYDPSSGRILWDGIDLRNVTKQSLRKRVALVPQDTSLFDRSIRENIAYGRPDVLYQTVKQKLE
jgi:ABC-type multidrug transport system fused ATPase/permease subunit